MTAAEMHTLVIILVMAAVTALIRFLPFLVFAKGTPKPLLYLGNVLPYATMAMLLIYCLKDIDFASHTHGLPELISVAFVVLLHKWRHNTLLSIAAGTILYMVLIQVVF